MNWTRQEAVELCILLEPIAAKFECHIALTGGLLYKEGPCRKDCDIIIYRAGLPSPAARRGTFFEAVNRNALLAAFEKEGVIVQRIYNRVVKATYKHLRTDLPKPVDFIFPECDGAYPVVGEEAV